MLTLLDKYILVLCISIIDVITVCFHVIYCNCVLSMSLLIPAVFCVIMPVVVFVLPCVHRLPITANPWDMDAIYIYLPTQMYKISFNVIIQAFSSIFAAG